MSAEVNRDDGAGLSDFPMSTTNIILFRAGLSIMVFVLLSRDLAAIYKYKRAKDRRCIMVSY